MRFNVNSIHGLYVFLDPFHERNQLLNFYALLRACDESELKWFLEPAARALGIRVPEHFETEEERTDFLFQAVRSRCDRLAGDTHSDHFVAYSLVTFILNYLQRRGDEQYRAWNVFKYQAAIEHFRRQKMLGTAPRREADHLIRCAEESLNNEAANTVLFRDRYNEFCENVVKYLLPEATKADVG